MTQQKRKESDMDPDIAQEILNRLERVELALGQMVANFYAIEGSAKLSA